MVSLHSNRTLVKILLCQRTQVWFPVLMLDGSQPHVIPDPGNPPSSLLGHLHVLDIGTHIHIKIKINIFKMKEDARERICG